MRVRLYAASSASDTDLMAKLLDVWPNGFAQRLCDGMVRARFREGMDRPSLIDPGRVYAYDIDCWNTSQVFKKGHRICVEIASSAFPKYDRNPNTGAAGPIGRAKDRRADDLPRSGSSVARCPAGDPDEALIRSPSGRINEVKGRSGDHPLSCTNDLVGFRVVAVRPSRLDAEWGENSCIRGSPDPCVSVAQHHVLRLNLLK